MLSKVRVLIPFAYTVDEVRKLNPILFAYLDAFFEETKDLQAVEFVTYRDLDIDKLVIEGHTILIYMSPFEVGDAGATHISANTMVSVVYGMLLLQNPVYRNDRQLVLGVKMKKIRLPRGVPSHLLPPKGSPVIGVGNDGEKFYAASGTLEISGVQMIKNLCTFLRWNILETKLPP